MMRQLKATPHKDSAADAQPIFSSECAKRANNLTVIKRVLCRMTEKEQADVVLSRKAFFVRCCLNCIAVIYFFRCGTACKKTDTTDSKKEIPSAASGGISENYPLRKNPETI